MDIKYFKIIFLLFVSTFSWTTNIDAQRNKEASHIKVAMRMIGHQVLLLSGDTTSVVLPIVQNDNQYTIQFETEFQFDPTELVATIKKIITESNIATDYLVEVEKCGTQDIVYSFEISDSKASDLMPCGGRLVSKSCYVILISLQKVIPLETELATKEESSFLTIGLITMGLLSLIGLLAFFWKKRNQPTKNITPTVNPNIISIGTYAFDKISMKLSHQDETVELTGKEADLLLLLHQSANKTLEREAILKNVWGDEGDYVGRTLDVFISKLRKKLKADANVKIVNTRGVGYKLVMSVNPVAN